MPLKRFISSRSRLNACTMCIPEICSCRNELSRATCLRVSRYCTRTLRRNWNTPYAMAGITASTTSASTQFRENMKYRMKAIRNRLPIMTTTPADNTSLSASTSLVVRVISRPTGVRSKKRSGCRWIWRKTFVRRS